MAARVNERKRNETNAARPRLVLAADVRRFAVLVLAAGESRASVQYHRQSQRERKRVPRAQRLRAARVRQWLQR